MSAAERLAAMDRAAVAFQPDRCLLAIDKFSTCEGCTEVCPVRAIEPGTPPNFQSDACTGCLACLPACPTGAFTAEDELGDVLSCLARIHHGPVEILCARNPHPEWGISDATAIRIRHCLAGIGTGGYLAMATLGVSPLFVRLEACPDCSLTPPNDWIERQIGQANSILQSLNRPSASLNASTEALATRSDRQVWDAHNPPLSRRDLFKLIGSSGKTALAHSLALDHQSNTRQPALDHRRMVAAVRRLLDGNTPPASKLEAGPFATLQVGPGCSACGTCVRSCPNKALEMVFDREERQYILAIRPADCNGCEVCLHVCGPQAIQIDHSPACLEVFTPALFTILSEGNLQRCERCSQLFAPIQGTSLCPVCEYRRNHPFSAGLPSHLRLQGNEPVC